MQFPFPFTFVVVNQHLFLSGITFVVLLLSGESVVAQPLPQLLSHSAFPILLSDLTGTNEQQLEGDRLFQAAVEHRQSEHYEEALEHFRKALVLYETVSDRQGQIDTLNQMGNVYLSLRQHDRAAEFYQRALAIDIAPNIDSALDIDSDQETTDSINSAPDIGSSDQEATDSTDPLISAIEFSTNNEITALQSPDLSPPNWGIPGGSRGFSFVADDLVALVLDSQTLAAYPTLFVYISDVIGSDVIESDVIESDVIESDVIESSTDSDKPFDLTFSLWDENNQAIYQITHSAPDTPGILGIRFEQLTNLPPLDLNTLYRWELALTSSDPTVRRINSAATGWIERVEHSETVTTDIVLARQPYVYSKAGIWYDAARALFEIYQTDPNYSTIDIDNALLELLMWAGISRYVTPDDFIGYWPTFATLPLVDSPSVDSLPVISNPASDALSETAQKPPKPSAPGSGTPGFSSPDFGVPGGTSQPGGAR